MSLIEYVVVQINYWFKFYFPLFLSMVMYDNEFETMENRIEAKDKIEPQLTFLFLFHCLPQLAFATCHPVQLALKIYNHIIKFD